MNLKIFQIGFALACALMTTWATDSERPANIGSTILSEPPLKIYNRKLVTLIETNRSVFRLDERNNEGLAWWPDTSFTNGTIEFEVRGTNAFQKSFVGVAFHGLNVTTYDVVYFRPFNFQSDNPVRRSYGVQYVALPIYTWNKLRDEHPGEFESQIIPAPAPNEWLHVRIVVEQPVVQVFVNHAEKPSLVVKQLSDRKSGWVGIWTGNGSGGDFANLEIISSP